ncbi:MFS transporter [Halorubellus sp. JP-L1]|uniref:MFS transporter n=1 Tax=Halorubellus sp. JP-L1 TaxID=2715753 RepID=UPI00140B8CAC|nr:MFS transporter [Halorubellus sp. JP-L1]NHN42276.1 MFS transporter [Halorubellus sp. JP-L1]
MVFLVNFPRVAFAPMLDTLAAAFDVTSQGKVGLIATLVWLGSALPRIPTGWVLTRVPRHRVILATGVVLAVAATFTTFAWSLPSVYVGSLLMGLASGAYFMAANPLVSELFPERVGRAVGIHGTASQTAAVAAPLFVGAVLAAAWLVVPFARWRLVFAFIAALAAATTTVFYVVSRRVDLPDAGDADRDLFAAARAQWPLILAGVVFLGFTGFVWNGVFNFYVQYLDVVKDVPRSTGRVLLTVLFAAGVPAFWATGRLMDRLPHVSVILAVLAGIATMLAVLTVTSGLYALVAVSVVFGFVVHASFPAMDVYLLDALPDEHRSSAYALYSGVMMIGQATGSVAVGTMRDLAIPFTAIFQGFALALGGLVLALVALHAVGRLPTSARAVR